MHGDSRQLMLETSTAGLPRHLSDMSVLGLEKLSLSSSGSEEEIIVFILAQLGPNHAHVIHKINKLLHDFNVLLHS